MKKFIFENWYKLMVGSSLFMAAFGFMVYSVSAVSANNSKENFNSNNQYKLIPTNADGSINVKLSNDQLDKIIPKNDDGSINVKLLPNGTVDVNLVGILGVKPDWTMNSEYYDGTSKHARLTVDSR